ncbi:MAG: hypothetical protein ACM339_08710, partial [Ignavibacteria bacterium]
HILIKYKQIIKMETLIRFISPYFTISIPGFKKLNDHLFNPLIAGFWGFTTILMIIFFTNLLSFFIGSDEKFGIDYLDFLLAGGGFFFQMMSALFKSLVK